MERVLTEKANYLSTHGYDVYIIITDRTDKEPYYPLNASIKVYRLDIGFEEIGLYPFFFRYSIYKKKMAKFKQSLNDCLHRIKPCITVCVSRRDINFINHLTDGSIKIAETHIDKAHYISFVTPRWMPTFVSSYLQRQRTKELGKLSKLVVLTHEDANSWTELKNVTVIPNPVSFFPEETSDCTAKRVIAAGRYFPQKGFDKLIAAWHDVSDKHPDWELHIYGDGWLREKMQAQVESLQLKTTCFLEHSTSNIVPEYLGSSIFVLSSNFEGFGVVIVEAMSCGLPVVSFACPCGPKDIISDKKDGFLVEVDDIADLADKLNWLIEHEEQRIEMGRNARMKAQKYRIEQIGKQWEDLFDELLTIKKNGNER
jgi:glycosyltransferase involved in cell wall biosynthesis